MAKISSILEYQDKIRQRLFRVYDAYKDKKHLETFLNMLVQFEDLLPPKGVIVIPNLRSTIYKASNAKITDNTHSNHYTRSW
ncbi:44891_t:CDS:2 [Gigaspora margarita]|uniref:44891_t:CDS:1 n=1 Tax=Gigaspora margarita TaxID=4874 RepID=A0ABN7ULV9_GIGMA|nr:44891_t:CDS:2 [Gigaspora margarita]